MTRTHCLFLRAASAAVVILAFIPAAFAQGTLADYERGQSLRTKAQGLVVNEPRTPTWIGESDHFWYARAVKGGSEFVLVDAATGTKKPAFDQEKLASAINAASGGHYTTLALPFAAAQGGRGGAGGRGGTPTAAGLTFLDNEQSIEFGVSGFMYKCSLSDYACSKGNAIPTVATGRGGRSPEAEEEPAPYVSEENGGDPVDGLEYQPFPQAGGAGGAAGRGQAGCAPASQGQAAQGGGRGGRGGRGAAAAAANATETPGCRSFDGKWIAVIENYNIFLRSTGSNEPATPISFDGSEGNYYTLRSVAWSPDSKKLVAYHTRPGYDRQVHYIQSSPADQVQPKHFTTNTLPNAAISGMYRKPGCSISRPGRKSKSTTSSSRIRTTLLRPCGGKTAALLPSNTISAGIRFIASSRRMRRRARRGR
jgi:hypothetical protein